VTICARETWTLVCAWALALAGCCPEPRAPEAGSAAEISTLGARLSTLQRDLLDKHCVTDCHDGASAAAALPLNPSRSYGALVNQRSQQISTQIRVVPGDAAASYLVKKMLGGAGIVGDIMPKLAPPRPASEIDGLRGWITRGAPND
jgi:hypothetical protein